jgi:hypothetical protein
VRAPRTDPLALAFAAAVDELRWAARAALEAAELLLRP